MNDNELKPLDFDKIETKEEKYKREKIISELIELETFAKLRITTKVIYWITLFLCFLVGVDTYTSTTLIKDIFSWLIE
jgi:hypothetical protein